LKVKWFALQFAISAVWYGLMTFLIPLGRFHSSHDLARPLRWAVVAALSHSLLGLRFMRATNSVTSKRGNPEIKNGLIALALRYFTSVGLVSAGLLAFPAQRTVFAICWSGLFLILTVSEMIVFIKGVNRL